MTNFGFKKKLSDEELAERVEILCENYGNVEYLVKVFNVPKNDREDVVQEIFVLAYRNIGQLKDMDCLDSWLYKIAYRYVLGIRRKYEIKEEAEFYYEDYPIELEDLSSSKETWEIMDNDFTDETLVELINSLKPPAPEILRLRFKMGFTLKEIAVILDMNYNSVKTIESRALKRLRDKIEQRGKNDE